MLVDKGFMLDVRASEDSGAMAQAHIHFWLDHLDLGMLWLS